MAESGSQTHFVHRGAGGSALVGHTVKTNCEKLSAASIHTLIFIICWYSVMELNCGI